MLIGSVIPTPDKIQLGCSAPLLVSLVKVPLRDRVVHSITVACKIMQINTAMMMFPWQPLD